MRLSTLVDDAVAISAGSGWGIAGPDVEIAGLAIDSREVVPGDLFFAVPGASVDGHDYAEAAVEAGAAAVMVERLLDIEATQVIVADVREAMAWASTAFHGRPCRSLSVVGVTGTNGKTTIASLIADIARYSGYSANAMGTLTGVRTTPESPRVQGELATLVTAGADVVAMEVSSHALDQARVLGCWFEVVIFANLSPDHLDYHVDMERYYAAKARLFTRTYAATAVINTADVWGARLADETSLVVHRVDEGSASALELRSDGSSFTWRGHRVELALAGEFNVTNAVLAAEACVVLGIPEPDIVAALAQVAQVPGRFERVWSDPLVVVDYAHTPDGLEQVLRSLQGLAGSGRVIVVFGCGGDRDREKRPLMGAAAAQGADMTVVTSDNPRSENPGDIIAEVVAGMHPPPDHVEPDRRAAIAVALGAAAPGDIVLIAGKGHETTQTIGDEIVDFDDRVVARELLEGAAAS